MAASDKDNLDYVHQDKLLKQFFATTYPDVETELLNGIKKLKLRKIILKNSQKEDWNSLYNLKLTKLVDDFQDSIDINNHRVFIAAVLSASIITLGVFLSPWAIAIGVLFVIATLYFLTDSCYKSFTQDRGELHSNYYKDLQNVEEERPDPAFTKKLIKLIDYFKENKTLITLDLSACSLNDVSLGQINSALDSNQYLKIILPTQISTFYESTRQNYLDNPMPEITQELITSVENKSKLHSCYNSFYVFFAAKTCVESNEIPKDISKIILEKLIQLETSTLPYK